MSSNLNTASRRAFGALNRLVRPLLKLGVATPPPVGLGVVVVATTGRRSGLQREVPLAATRVGDTVVVSTVRRGSDWVKNLESDPAATIWLGGCARDAEASVERFAGLSVATLRLSVGAA